MEEHVPVECDHGVIEPYDEDVDQGDGDGLPEDGGQKRPFGTRRGEKAQRTPEYIHFYPPYEDLPDGGADDIKPAVIGRQGVVSAGRQ